jgi:hypothetical protein
MNSGKGSSSMVEQIEIEGEKGYGIADLHKRLAKLKI